MIKFFQKKKEFLMEFLEEEEKLIPMKLEKN
jgi:hypothetical protein